METTPKASGRGPRGSGGTVLTALALSRQTFTFPIYWQLVIRVSLSGEVEFSAQNLLQKGRPLTMHAQANAERKRENVPAPFSRFGECRATLQREGEKPENLFLPGRVMVECEPLMALSEGKRHGDVGPFASIARRKKAVAGRYREAHGSAALLHLAVENGHTVSTVDTPRAVGSVWSHARFEMR